MSESGSANSIEVVSPMAGTVTHVAVAVGEVVSAGQAVAFVEAMKMEQRVAAEMAGTVLSVAVTEGGGVEAGDVLLTLTPVSADAAVSSSADAAVSASDADTAPSPGAASADGDADGTDVQIRADLREVLERRAALEDAARPDAVAKRHARGHRTARENVADLCDDGSFVEYGGLAIAAQRSRRSLDELIERTPADGLVTGIGTVNADLVGVERARVAVAAYDYTVLAGTQGHANHHKKDRLFQLVEQLRIPLVVFAEGGGGRPGDTDNTGASWLDAEAFHLFARLSGEVPLVSVVAGRCFAGNAALAGCADVIIATEDANLGMAGPAMIEGGGLGVHAPEAIGPMDVQRANGVVDVVVPDEAAAVAIAARYLGYFQGAVADWDCADQELLRDLIPENRKRVYDVREVATTLFDHDSVLELRPDFAPGMMTALARIEGRPVGVIANDPTHLGGAIDADGSDTAARFLQLCDAHDLPVVVLCDTPGFMVGPEAEREGGVRHFSRMFVAGANLRVPLITVVLRKAYGLGAQAMMGGHLKVPILTIGWPTSEFGPMGLEGAVRLGFRRELEAIDDPDEREQREEEMVALAYETAKGLNVASFAEIDDVIDPADTRLRVVAALAARPATDPSARPRRSFVDTW